MRGRVATLVWGLVGAAAVLGACDDAEVPMGPPRCEPEREHELDRRLKLGFKALALGQRDQARDLFKQLLADEPGHPEGLLGQRLAAGMEPSQLSGGVGANGDRGGVRPSGLIGPEVKAPPTGIGAILVAGVEVPVDLVVDATRWRFEELRELAKLRAKRDGSGNVFTYFAARKQGGKAIPETREALDAVVDLVVLHDTRTVTARDSIVELEGAGGSSHFVIDWDGKVFQTLDLLWEGNHSKVAETDRRSIAIDLVNPVVLGTLPGLPQEAEDKGEHRPLSEFVQLQGEEVQQWGYTDAQITSLEKLVRELGRIFPRIILKVPRDAEGAVPRKVLRGPLGREPFGVVGHLHVSPRAVDPGAGFPWEAFAKAIGQR